MKNKNNIIQETVCEINFEKKWDVDFWQQFFNKIKNEFSQHMPFSIINMGLAQQGELLMKTGMRYHSNTSPLIIHLFEYMLTINILPKYPGWDEASKSILKYCNECFDVIKPEKIKHIKLRYINKITKKNEKEELRIWLKPNDYIPKHTLIASDISYNFSFSKNENNKSLIALKSIDNKNVLFDINCTRYGDINLEKNTLSEVINNLHENIKNIFSISIKK